MAGQVQEGDKVSWNGGGSHPSGTAGEVQAGEVTVTSHRGNEISKTGDKSNPAVHIERSGNDVVKTADELNVDKKAESSIQNGTSSSEKPAEDNPEEKPAEKQDEKKEEASKPAEEEMKDQPMPNTDTEGPKAGDKRKADDQVDAEAGKKQEENGEDNKKQKTEAVATNGENKEAEKKDGGKEKKRPGRPKGPNSKPAKEKKEPTVGKAARKTRSQAAAEEKST